MTVTVVDVLRRAMERITPEGTWIQRQARRDANPAIGRPTGYCAGGVINYTVGSLILPGDMRNDYLRSRAFYALEQAIGIRDIPGWNDDPSRTHEDVLLAFKRAIEIAEDSQ